MIVIKIRQMFKANMWRIFVTPFVLFILTSHPSFAHPGVVLLNSEAIKKVDINNESGIYIYPETTSDDHISHIKASSFISWDSTLYIVNHPKLNSALVTPPSLIIVENISPFPLMIKDVKVIGSRADILFTSRSGIICHTCQFENAKRITLAAGDLRITGDSVSIENRSKVRLVNNLQTQDVDSIDILGEEYVQSGAIMTFAKVSKSNDGSYQFDGQRLPSSQKNKNEFIASQTRVNINVGKNIIDYHTLDSTFYGGNSQPKPLELNRPIYAGSLSIQAFGDVDIKDTLQTQSDVMILSEGKNQSLTPLGDISVTTFGDINIGTANIKSATSIALKGKNISITPTESYKNVSLEADKVLLVAANTITNYGLITASTIHITAKTLLNSGGEIFAKEDIFFQTDELIKNSDRGMLIGNNVYLDAGIAIQNGQMTPWSCKSNSSTRSGSIHIDSDDVDLGSGAGTIVSSEYKACPEDRRQYWSQEQREALIFGFNVALNAPHVSNTNPKLALFSDYADYISKTSENIASSDKVLKVEDSSNVMISAENTLQIDAQSAVKNGSATIEVFNGDFDIVTPNLENQRYYIAGRTSTVTVPWEQPSPMSETCRKKESNLKGLPGSADASFLIVHELRGRLISMVGGHRPTFMGMMRFIDNQIKGCEIYVPPFSKNNKIITMKKTANWLAANSPVPRLLVGKNLNIQGSSFSNLAGNVEILGTLNGDLNKFENLGLTLRDKLIEHTTTFHVKSHCSRRVFSVCVRRKTKRWTTFSERFISQQDSQQIPAYFYLGSGELNITGTQTPDVDSEGVVNSGNITYGRF